MTDDPLPGQVRLDDLLDDLRASGEAAMADLLANTIPMDVVVAQLTQDANDAMAELLGLDPGAALTPPVTTTTTKHRRGARRTP